MFYFFFSRLLIITGLIRIHILTSFSKPHFIVNARQKISFIQILDIDSKHSKQKRFLL